MFSLLHTGFHPLFVMFPLPLLSVILVWECLFAKKVISGYRQIYILWSLVIGAVSLAFFSGYFAHDHSSVSGRVPEDFLSFHHSLGRAALCSCIFAGSLSFLSRTAAFYKKSIRTLYFSMLLLSLLLVAMTGHRGAELVFLHGAGVKHDSKD